MDKETLSNYGWIVICVLVLAVMIALATPFGNFVADAVKSTANGLFMSQYNALDAVGIETNSHKINDENKIEEIVYVATFNDGTKLTLKDLKNSQNGEKYGYDASKISDDKIMDFAFQNCKSIIKITIPNGISYIGKKAFQNCENLVEILFSPMVRYVETSAFENCSKLSNIKLNEGLIDVSTYAFSGCKNLTSINIPSSINHIGENAFFNCINLKEIYVNKNNSTFCSSNGILYSKNMNKIIKYPAGKTEKTFTIPDSVTVIGNHAFEYALNLEMIDTGNNISTIEWYAFENCVNLKSIKLPRTLQSIGQNCYSSCQALEQIVYEGTELEWNNIDKSTFNLEHLIVYKTK